MSVGTLSSQQLRSLVEDQVEAGPDCAGRGAARCPAVEKPQRR